MRFGLSTHLFHAERLTQAHVDRIAAAGFDAVELFATRTHFDYRDDRHISDMATWLRSAGVAPISVHLPISEGLTAGVWGRAYSTASPSRQAREDAVEETRAALRAAGALGCATGVLHIGIPDGQPGPNDGNSNAAARESVVTLARAAEETGVRLALEVIPNALSSAGALVDLFADLDLGLAGVCLDFGHAHMRGGVSDAVETLSGHVITTHVHDNRGRDDEHLVPFDGTIDWPAALTSVAKVGYAGPLIFEVAALDDAERTLARTVEARRRLQTILDELGQGLTFEETEP